MPIYKGNAQKKYSIIIPWLQPRLENKKCEEPSFRQHLCTSHPGHWFRFALHLCSNRGFRRSSCCSTRWCSFFKALNSSSNWWCHGYRTKTWNANAEEATPKLMSEIPRVIHMAEQTEDWLISNWAENGWIEDLRWTEEKRTLLLLLMMGVTHLGWVLRCQTEGGIEGNISKRGSWNFSFLEFAWHL